jgi:hypothetical protein
VTAAYDALVALAEREHALAAAGRTEELAELDAERRALVAALPAQAPRTARRALERTAELQAATTRLLAASAASARSELRTLGRGRDATRAYGRAA